MEQIGSGSQGAVFRVSNVSDISATLTTNNPVAVKIFRAESAYHREMHCAKLCNGHLNVVRVLGSETRLARNGRWLGCIYMELAETDLLSYVVTHGFMPVDLQESVVVQMIKGLRHVHDNGVAHLDLKPENCLLAKRYAPSAPGCDADGFLLEAKWADFGFSHIVCENNTHLKGVWGTMSYIAPEQFLNESFCVFRADVWSLGITAFTLSGRAPWCCAEAKDRNFSFYLENGIDPFLNAKKERMSQMAVHVARTALQLRPENRPFCNHICIDIDTITLIDYGDMMRSSA